MISLKVGELIPLLFVPGMQFEGLDISVKAKVFSLFPYTEHGSDLVLTMIPSSDGEFFNGAIAMPDKPRVYAVYYVTDEDLSAVIEITKEVFSKTSVSIANGDLMIGTILDTDIITAEITK